ncbi:MAG: AI-2E family transporter [Gammaproteobacteria bacterium]|jgi:predicted PurR-regulated permease PerM|nr:AI-2E family transporter [Gammaproteobacteria bacterium]
MTQTQTWFFLVLTVLVALLIYLLQPILGPFVLGMGIAYMADPFADRLEARGYSRTMAVILVFLGLTLVLVSGLLLAVPLFIKQLQSLVGLVPDMQSWFNHTMLPYLQTRLDIDVQSLELDLLTKTVSAEWQQQAGGIASQIMSYVTASTLGLVGLLGSTLLVPVVSFYLLRDFDILVAKMRDMLPRNLEPKVTLWVRECDEVLGAFVRGQLLVMLVLGLIYGIGLSVVGLKYAMLIGLLAGLASIVPYLGFAVGFVAAMLVALFQFDSYWGFVAVTLVFVIGQALEGMVLTPWLIGDRIGLHPVAVIFAVLAGGQLFGFTGMLLALPLAAVIMVLLRHLHEGYRNSLLYDQ